MNKQELLKDLVCFVSRLAVLEMSFVPSKDVMLHRGAFSGVMSGTGPWKTSGLMPWQLRSAPLPAVQLPTVLRRTPFKLRQVQLHSNQAIDSEAAKHPVLLRYVLLPRRLGMVAPGRVPELEPVDWMLS